MYSWNSSTWLGLEWSEWIGLDASLGEFQKHITTDPGFYRVRVRPDFWLSYIGQTGRNLRERTRSLALHTHRDRSQPPWNDPHTAASAHWAFRQEEDFNFDISVTPCHEDSSVRECTEDWLLFEYRQESGLSTLCNHGRIHPRWTRPSNRKAGREMLRNSAEDLVDSSKYFPPASKFDTNKNDPRKKNWLGLGWSDWLDLKSPTCPVPTETGVYRLRNDSEIIYFGETVDLKTRLKNHAHQFPAAALLASYDLMPGATKVELHERESDLIGSFWKEKGMPPRFQYGAEG